MVSGTLISFFLGNGVSLVDVETGCPALLDFALNCIGKNITEDFNELCLNFESTRSQVTLLAFLQVPETPNLTECFDVQ